MQRLKHWQLSTVLVFALSLGAGIVTSLAVQASAQAQTTVQFSDVPSNYWARGFIEELTRRGIVNGFPDGSFRPDAPVTRSQFAAMVQKAFDQAVVRDPIRFTDVSERYWASEAIREAYTTGFMTGYPDGSFNPNQNILRAQVLVSLANGLSYSNPNSVSDTLQVYNDANDIPDYARPTVAAATEKQLVVNYPNLDQLNPTRIATRAEVAAFIYQALVSAGNADRLTSPYIVGQAAPSPTPSPQPQGSIRIPSGTTLPTRYDDADKIYVSPQEPEPVPVTLLIDRDIIAQNGRLLIPINSQVVGELQSVRGGSQFRARELVLATGTRIPMDASSSLVTRTEVVRQNADVGEILTGVALGAGAAAGISAVTGDRSIDAGEVLGGAAFGGLIGYFRGRDRVTLITINPDDDLDVTLNDPLVLP
ncbi:S-layer homology domain-containing protein [Oscillatoria sp. FACHB-1407]|uniref:S-layer homology domain-containing protein n=1 Tax=Oscillatoria sp. FACHB-1407 TaxID=2692847 RepID=UPI001689E433|nr:S-layer homology domain-containing protein [Oscillatoria sp. FACHB-1407]MBD2464350.1 S-layer homology domain-containing protein [Oscillatoria sp. FACHB-1407]